MEWLINRRRMMFNKALPPVYLSFEDSRFWEICCYNWGDVEEVTGSVDTGTLNCNGTSLVISDYVFASCLEAPARVLSNRTNFTRKSAAARQFVVDIDFGTNTPFESIASDAVVIEVKQYGKDTTSIVTLISETKDNITIANNKVSLSITTSTAACQYITVAVLADNNITASWTLSMASGSVIYRPVGITQTQCSAVTSTGDQFRKNRLVVAMDEWVYFTSTTKFLYLMTFDSCKALRKITIPANYTQIPNNMISSCTANAIRIICLPVTPPPGYNNKVPPNFGVKPLSIYVPDESVNTYKETWTNQATIIYPLSDLSE